MIHTKAQLQMEIAKVKDEANAHLSRIKTLKSEYAARVEERSCLGHSSTALEISITDRTKTQRLIMAERRALGRLIRVAQKLKMESIRFTNKETK